jgi:hypothetical protein
MLPQFRIVDRYARTVSMRGLLVLMVMTVPVAGASVTYSASSTLGPSANQITYTEQLTYIESGRPPLIGEWSTPCNLAAGCEVGSLTLTLPELTLPVGAQVQDATLHLGYSSEVTFSALDLVSLVPIDPSRPAIAGDPGNHYYGESLTISSALGTNPQPLGSIEDFWTYSTDYTSPVMDALANGGALTPISLSEDILYGFKTVESAGEGFNDISTFQQTVGLQSAELDAYLQVDYTAVPEPSGFVCCSLWGLAFTLSRVRIRR